MGPCLATITCKHQRGARSGIVRELNIRRFVADDKRTRQLDIMLARSHIEHASLRFSTLTGDPVARISDFGMMRAVVDRVDSRPLPCEILNHCRVNSLESFFGVYSAGDARLIGYDYCFEPGPIDQAHGLGRPG